MSGVQDQVAFTAVPSSIQRGKQFTLEVKFNSEAVGKIRFSVDEGRTIFPSSIDVGAEIVNGNLKDLFVINGGGSDNVNITCSLRHTETNRLVPLTS
jgi:hypothetical protein